MNQFKKPKLTFINHKEAVGHIQLILNDKSGKLITDFKAKKHVISKIKITSLT